MIYNPWFDAQGIDAVVVPARHQAGGLPATCSAALFRITTLHGALVTMPHKVTTMRIWWMK